MQLGARWEYGESPHSGVPEILHAEIRRAEQEHRFGDSWTFTWLEGRPRVELLDSEATVLADIGLDSLGNVRSWISVGDVDGYGGVPDNAYPDEDDDDDWLS